MLVTSICPARVLPLQAPFHIFFWKMYILVIIIIFFHFISARYSSHSFCHRAMNEVSKRAA